MMTVTFKNYENKTNRKIEYCKIFLQINSKKFKIKSWAEIQLYIELN